MFFMSFWGLRPANPRESRAAQWPIPSAKSFVFRSAVITTMRLSALDQEMASLLSQHQDAVERLAEVPGLGVDSAQQIIAEVGATAATFPSEKRLSSSVGACPADEGSINFW
jgi:Transposase IS116/IS110/IS902 family